MNLIDKLIYLSIFLVVPIFFSCHNKDINMKFGVDGGDDLKRYVQFMRGDEILHSFQVELAVSEQERGRGLMYRKELPEDHGMLFIFQKDADHTFWMKNTYIPFDMIFIDSELKVVGVYRNATPLSEDSISIGKKSRYVLEINAGLSDKFGIGEGARVVFINIFP